jgi:hypothetical protein
MSEMDEQTSENKPDRDENGRLLPGSTANPNGRPKGSLSITKAIKDKLAEIQEGDTRTNLEVLVDIILKKALVDKDDKTIESLWKFVDGMPKQSATVEHTLPDNLIDALRNTRTLQPGEYTVLPAKDPE